MGTIKLTSTIKNDKYTEYIYDKFDIQDSEQTTSEVSYDFSKIKGLAWNIGVIYGSSGSGKTTILKKVGKGELSTCSFDGEKSLISNFDWLSPDEATVLLTSMGLSSVPTWLRPFHLLSNGEQYRAELAYKVGKAKDGEIILIDEFTSVVDRDVAKAMSFALQKYIRKTGKKIILASCHYDIMEWLMPDWTCSPQKNGGALEIGQWLRQGRPGIELQISRVEYGAWDFFKKHHYLTGKVSKSCKFILFSWNGKPVGINCVIPQPSGMYKKGVRESRIVVLPDFQGLGLGTNMSKLSAAMYRAEGYKYFTKTIHPALGEYRNAKPELWRKTSSNGKKTTGNHTNLNWTPMRRVSYCHEYVGPVLEGYYEEILLPVGIMRENKKQTLFNQPEDEV